MCKHRFGVQLLHNPPLYSITVFTVLNSYNFWCPCCCWRPVVVHIFLSFLLSLAFMLFARILVAAVVPASNVVLVDPGFNIVLSDLSHGHNLLDYTINFLQCVI
jgi:hypothetical protein